MGDASELIETFEARRKQLQMRLVIAVLMVLCYGHLVGWQFALGWICIYYALQFAELRIELSAGAGDGSVSRLTRWQAYLVLFANGVVFGSWAIASPLTYGAWGMANGAFVLAGAILNVAVSNRNKTSFLISLLPYALYFPAMAVVSLLIGASWPVTLSLLVSGPMVLAPTVMMWFLAERLRATEEEAQRRRLHAEQANSAKDAFLAMMSHEIRTPLNGVLGMAHAMERDELTDTQRERIRVIREAGQNLFVILDDILDLSKIEAGKLALEDIEFDLEAVIRGSCSAFISGAEEKGLTLEVDVCPQAAAIYRGDPTRLRQIVCNLVANAVKFTNVGGVRVAVTTVQDQLCLTVSDTGLGMEADQLEGLFKPFSQADLSTTRRFGGTGLGLSITRQLAEAMGGRIEVKSRSGAGSTFSVYLPLEQIGPRPVAPQVEAFAAREADPACAPTTRRGDAIRILAAEDNPTNQLVLRTLLGQAGLSVTVVSDGEQAVRAWRDGDWTMILMDVRMPIMDGPTAAAEIRRQEAETGRARTPIVALTANVMPHQVADYTRAGMDDLIAKPIDIAALFATIERLMAAETEAERDAA